VGWSPGLRDEIQDAGEPEAGREYQEACLTVLPGENRLLPYRAVPPLDEEPAHPAVLVVPVPDSDSGAPFQGVSGVEGSAENPVGGGVE